MHRKAIKISYLMLAYFRPQNRYSRKNPAWSDFADSHKPRQGRQLLQGTRYGVRLILLMARKYSLYHAEVDLWKWMCIFNPLSDLCWWNATQLFDRRQHLMIWTFHTILYNLSINVWQRVYEVNHVYLLQKVTCFEVYWFIIVKNFNSCW